MTEADRALVHKLRLFANGRGDEWTRRDAEEACRIIRELDQDHETERTYLNARLALVGAEADKDYVNLANRWGRCIRTIRRLRRRYAWEKRRAERKEAAR